jgi:ribosomal protein L16 Arg81 hydroxylase
VTAAEHEVSHYLRPVGFERFLAEIWGQTYLYLRGADGQYACLLPWAELSRILDEHRLDFPRVRLVRSGRPLPPAEYRVFERGKRGDFLSHLASERVERALQNGATLVIDSVDEMYQPLRHLADVFADAFRSTVRINAYLSAGSEAGFLPHWDDHEVIVLQVYGQKHWKVFGTGTRFPIRHGGDGDLQPADQASWEGPLRAGDLLYLPRGCWHVALAERAPTLHLSVGIHNKTGIDFIEWLQTKLHASESFRMDLPLHAGRSAQNAHGERLLAELTQLWRPEMLWTFIDEMHARTPRRRPFNLPPQSSE